MRRTRSRTRSTVATWAVAAALTGYAAAPALAAPAVAGPAYSPVPALGALAPAHSALVSSVPADGATLSAAPTEIVLTFNENINASFTQVAVTRGDAAVALAPVSVKGPEVRAQLAAPSPGPGAYRIAFRVVSADGHPISGETRFTVTGSTATTPATTASPSTASPTTASPTTASPTAAAPTSAAPAPTDPAAQPAPAGSSRVPGFLIAGALIAAAVGLVAWDRARR